MSVEAPIHYCPEKLKPGGCQLHNLHCRYPACDTMPGVPPELANCTAVLRASGKLHPRTCQVCGLGPCRWKIGDKKVSMEDPRNAPYEARQKQEQIDRLNQELAKLKNEVQTLKDNQQFKDDKHVAMGAQLILAYNNLLAANGKLLQENTKLRAELSLASVASSTKEIEDEQSHLEYRSTPVARLVAGEPKPQPNYDSMVGRQDLEH